MPVLAGCEAILAELFSLLPAKGVSEHAMEWFDVPWERVPRQCLGTRHYPIFPERWDIEA